MASTESLASWNPAFRPDSEDLTPTAEAHGDSAAPLLDEPLNKAPSSEPSFEVVAEGDLDTQTTDPWPSQDSEEPNDWLEEASSPNDEVVAEAQPVAPEEPDMGEVSTDTPEPTSESAAAEPDDNSAPSAPTPAGLDWTDADGDDGADWLVDDSKPAETSQHVPPADEANISPPVPPLDQDPKPSDHPLPRTQAQDLMEEKPDEEETIVGGSTDNIDPDATRYEEGLPLMGETPVQPDQVKSPIDTSTTSRANDAFADDEDDFFSHIQDSGKEATADPASQPWSLDRKSTDQAMGDVSAPPDSQESLFAGTPEVEEAAFFKSIETHAGETEEQQAPPPVQESPGEDTKTVDPDAIAAKWSEAFADDGLDEDFLDESPAQTEEPKEMDPATFFGSDDEGFLDDDDGFLDDQQPPTGSQAVGASTPTSAQSRYAPVTALSQNAAPNAYMAPTQPAAYQPSPITQTPIGYSAGAVPPTTAYGAPQPPRPDMPKAQSFADKSKGGYSSPYDLPMDVVDVPKPRKRTSMQQLPKASATGAVVQPPRSASMFTPGPPPPSASSPMAATSSSVPPMAAHQPPQAPKPKESFFEDLPITTKPRPGSRHSHTSSPGPFGYPSAPPAAHTPPVGPPQVPMAPTSAPPMASALTYAPVPPSSQTAALAYGGAPAQTSSPYASQPPVPATAQQSSGIANLVKPAVVNPYAPAPGQPHPGPPVPGPGNRYSPAPSQAGPPNGVPSHGTSNRYSPAPPLSRQGSFNYAPAPSSAAPAPILPHQPRTSSPLAHFEMTPDRSQPTSNAGASEPTYSDRRTSLPHEPRITRVPSLPPTREVDEEEDGAMMPPQSIHSAGAQGLAPAPVLTSSKYGPSPAAGARATPPPPMMPSGEATLSPPKRSHYAPLPAQAAAAKDGGFAPPPRSFSQSPTSRRTDINGAHPHEPIRRPSSVQSATPPRNVTQPAAPAYKPSHRARAPSLTLNMIPPTDGREHDPLQRWKGAPIVAWGVGGTFVSTFPKSVPRYGINQTAPMMVRNPGEVKVQHVKDILPPEDTLAKFPGPLKGKSKKKETIAWLNAGIDAMAKNIPDLTYTHHPSLEQMRTVERLLLWKILRVFIEYDGVLEGNPAIQKAVRSILIPGLDQEFAQDDSSAVAPVVAALQHQSTTTMRTDAVDSAGIELIRKYLMLGDREKAAWTAVDKRLWGHAMLIANTVSPDLYKQVAQEFVRKEVNYPGHNNESIAALYKVLSGNHEECVDELVPVHARAGLQLMATNPTQAPTKDALEGLDKWRETLTLILGNRCLEDVRALTSLGELLSSYGRAEAAHICFIFARHHSIFGGVDDPRSNFVLVGSDHRRQADQFFKDAEGLLLSEVYEYGLSLAGGAVSTTPHLSGYKLQLAMTLAEYGHRDRALQYCEGILTAISAQTKRSPYHHAHLEQAVEDFIKRLKQAPREESNSWIPKPSMNKVSDTMWSKFNKFVAGDDTDGAKNGAHGEEGVESGPFANIAGGTPTISRSPSVTNFEMQGTNHLGYPLPHAPPAMSVPALSSSAPAHPVSRTASRYAPAPQQQSMSAVNPYQPSTYTPRSSSELNRNPNPYEPNRPSTGHQQQYNPGMLSQPVSQPPQPAQSAPPVVGQEPSYPAPAQGYAPSGVPAPAPAGYTPLGMQEAASAPDLLEQAASVAAPAENQSNQGYQAPSYGYAPPAMEPANESVNEPEESESAEQPEASGGYEPPSYQPYGYEPPSYEPDSGENDDESSPKPKKKSFMDDDEDDIPALKATSGGKSKAEKDRENEEMVRRVAEEEEKRAAEKKAAKKGWGFGGWFGGGKKEASLDQANKPIKANLGEQSSFVYDPELKRWVNKKAGADTTEAKKATPPPPKGPPRSASSTPPPGMAPGTPPPPMGGAGRLSAPPNGPPRTATAPNSPPSAGMPPTSDGLAVPTAMIRSVSSQSAGGPPSGPPSRPATSMSNASSIDDLLSAAGPRKPGQKKARKTGRYVDVMAK